MNRRRGTILLIVVVVIAAIIGIGAVSRSTGSDTTVSAGTTATLTGAAVPSSLWYWTMAVSPTDPDVLVVGTANGLFRSTDGGKTWKPTGPKNFNATSVVQVGNSLYAGGAHATPTTSPVVKTGATRAATSGAAVFAVSTDGGQTWKAQHPAGLPNAALQAFAVDPANAQNFYAVLTSGKVYRSTDGAKTFKLSSTKIGIPPWAVAIMKGGQFAGGDMDTGPYLSSNGTAWKKTTFTDSRGTKMVMEYAVQPTDTTKVLMTSFGIEISTDSGKTWHTALKSPTMFGPIAYSSSKPDVAYAIGFDSTVWRSDDGGKSWTQVK
jgi:photosystem II stability/assembly factor-like uncharacterized protein